MRYVLTLVVISVGALAQPANAQGQNSRWCAEYGRGHGGTNCGFSSYEQCRAAISGNGGFCYRNPQYGGRR